jgi:penicillin amidase
MGDDRHDCAVGTLAAAALGYGYYRLRAARPLLQGKLAVAGLKLPVKIDRDAEGVPVVSGANRTDVAFALGFLHAQERFFQMDLIRRAGAGELAELLGKALLGSDRNARIHQFRQRAERIVASMEGEQRELLMSYSAGVLAGMRALGAPPFEYLLLRAQPVEWRPEDTLLVVFYMYQLLQDNRANQDFNLYLLYDTLPAGLADFLTPPGSPDWDAPLVGEPSPPAEIPGPDVLDLRGAGLERLAHTLPKPVHARGSNAWGVSAAGSGTGHAIIANDIHLRFGMPPSFYRATLEVAGPAGACRWSGITLPGLPFLVAGTNGDIAWGIANAEIDSVDLIRLDQAGLPPNAYRTADGVAEIETVQEVIHVRGGADETVDVHKTLWGPVARKAREGVKFAQWWTAYGADSANLEWTRLETAGSIGEAIDAAHRVGVPTLAIVVADRHGDVGWTLAGPLHRRAEKLGKLPVASSRIASSWDERVSSCAYPHLASPRFDRLWSANAKPIVGGEFDRLLGYGYFSLGARSLQIRNCLECTKIADERAMLAIQLEDRALFLSRWRTLLLEVLGSPDLGEMPRLAEMRFTLRHWDGRASEASVAYRLVRHFRTVAERLVFEPFISLVRAKHGEFALDDITDQLEAPLWRLIADRPRHLLAPWFTSWNDLLIAAVSEVLAAIPNDVSLASYTWGEENTLVMRHPLSQSMPLLGRLFDAPSAPLNGDAAMPLVQTSWYGPVVRFVIAPGQEDRAILQMPGGQAGNPLAPYYLAGHAAWLEGRPTPLLPGPTCYSLTLLPRAAPLPNCALASATSTA